ncbi:hypothetical protein [Thalassotalea ganghwensis]
MSSVLLSKVDRFIAFAESAVGVFFIALIAALCFLIYANQHPVGTIAPGTYYLGVILPTGMFFWSAAKQSNKKLKIAKATFGICFVAWAIANAVLRHS